MVCYSPAVMLPKIRKILLWFVIISGWFGYFMVYGVWLSIVLQSHLRVPGAWDSGARQSGIRAVEVWVTLGSEGSGFRVGNSDRLR